MAVYRNPIIPGFYPDPSICRVGEDYFLVCSTFMYFPGLPVFHSRDLANWTQIGNALHRPEQLALSADWHSAGIYAPTIRYIGGQFYIVCTNVGGGGHFIISAKNASGPWSDAVYLPGEGIDPTLFEDRDGRVWFAATRGKDRVLSRYDGDNVIWMREIDLETSTLTGPEHVLWEGYAAEAIWTEGPHIYYKEPYYYLLTSEGGTDFEHAIVISRAEQVTGPYRPCLHNPVLTHRHLGRSFPVVNVGHADLVDTPAGDWHIVALGSRPYGGYYRNLGRETFLGQVVWENGWPVVNPGTGHLLESGDTGLTEAIPEEVPSGDIFLRFSGSGGAFEDLDPRLVWIRGQQTRETFRPAPGGGGLALRASADRLDGNGAPAAVFRRQQHMNLDFSAEGLLPETLGENVSLGLTALQDNRYYIRLALRCSPSGEARAELIHRAAGEEELLETKALGSWEQLAGKPVSFLLEIRLQELRFGIRIGEGADIWLEHTADGSILSPDYSGSFVGTVLGAFIQDENRAGVSGDRLYPEQTAGEWTLYGLRYRPLLDEK